MSAAMSSKPLRAWMGVAGWTLLILFTVPLARNLQGYVSEHWGSATFTYVVLACIALAAAWGAGFLWRNRTRRPLTAWLCLAGVAGAFVWFTLRSRACPEEALHFVEYGVLGALLYYALSFHLRDASAYLAAVLLAGMAGLLDESLQWIIPRRYFDFRDIRFNLLAAVLVQVAIAFGLRPAATAGWPARDSWRRLADLAVAFATGTALCLLNTPAAARAWGGALPFIGGWVARTEPMVEYGYLHQAPGIGEFYSRFTLAQLQQEDAAQAARAATILPAYRNAGQYLEFLEEYPSSQEPFLHELRVRLYRRDHYRAVRHKHQAHPEMFAWHSLVAARENRLLERYFSKALAVSTYQLNPLQTAELEADDPPGASYRSPVSEHLIIRFTPWHVWAALALAWVCWAGARFAWRGRRGE